MPEVVGEVEEDLLANRLFFLASNSVRVRRVEKSQLWESRGLV